jgi:hypothetical protein
VTQTTSRKITLNGVMAEHARNKAHPGIILPKVKDHMLMMFGPDLDRDPTVIHPSEMAKPDWCPRATYLRIVSGKWPQEAEGFDFVRENIFATGNDIHVKWQERMIAAGLPMWGDWECRVCKTRARGCLKPNEEADWHEYHACDNAGEVSHQWQYAEVTLNARRELLIAGHSDGGFDNSLVEIKSIGLGTVRMDAPDLLRKHQDGRMTDLTGLWRDITRPLRSHLAQGDVYLHLAHVLGLPFDQIVYLYEFKPNQMVKEFTIKYDAGRSMRLIAKAEQIKYAVEHGIPPKCIKPSGCKQCSVFPKMRRTVAATRTSVT